MYSGALKLTYDYVNGYLVMQVSVFANKIVSVFKIILANNIIIINVTEHCLRETYKSHTPGKV